MKKMKSFFVILLSTLFSLNLSAQSGKLKSESIKVAGNCSMCKERIEKAALSAGASTASWDAATKLLKLSYDASKTNSDAIAKKVAVAGHDTEKFKAEEKVYNSLPGCCKYDRANISAPAKKMDHSGHSH